MKLLFALFLLLLPLASRGTETRVLFLGDSITWDGRWAARVEAALRSDPGYADCEIVNMALGSETTSGLSETGHAGGEFPRPCIHERLGRVLDRFKPTLIIACYGMNDGIYLPEDEARMNAYKEGMTLLRTKADESGARIIFVTPPLNRPDLPPGEAHYYDKVLDAQTAWLVTNRALGWEVIDIRPDLRVAITAAEAKDPAFVYAKDGVHPGEDGHRFIAEAVVKGLWPLLGAKEPPDIGNEASRELLYRRARMLRDAWLTATKHSRPGLPVGLPLPEAVRRAEEMLAAYGIVKAAEVSEWSGYERLDFTVDGRKALLVRPKHAAEGHPWIWRTEFFGHEPQADIALLGRGYHVAYIDVQDLYGAPVAMKHMDAFHDHLVEAHELSKKTTLEGFSRGGLFAFNWAALHPDRVASIYVDAPVCDFKSWPGGKGAGPGSAADWQKCLKAYGMSEAEALAYKKNPVDNLQPLAKAGIPMLAVVGNADEVVPVSENIDVVEKRYKELGGLIEVIRKPGAKHHPHSLPDPAPIVDFITRRAGR